MILQLVKQRACTGKGYQAVTLEEAGICPLRRTEEAVIPNPTEDDPGRTTNYRLCTDWMSTPAPKITTQVDTQVPECYRTSEGVQVTSRSLEDNHVAGRLRSKT